ncbi:MAG: Asp23/Gls24 family envelope stress response protein [Peptococcaceae bacterium]|nr:Asp23/Gls24 family envelope stress response protein [Peptococcaceae bacterium]
MELVALVGSSGTGKSHRAMIVAHEQQAGVIIDDGLLIQGNRILCGRSAKQQPTRIGAIKAALFMYPGQAEEAAGLLAELSPQRVLCLGTSLPMVRRVARQLNLPDPVRVIGIEQVATEKEIRKARFMRNHYAKHVIPAPTVEVRRSFPETLIDPLTVFLKRKSRNEVKSKWLEHSVVRPTFTYYGNLSISNSALTSIIDRAAREVSGVVSAGRIHIVNEEGGIRLEAEPVFLYGRQLREVARRMQENVKAKVEAMTGLTVHHVNVTVKGIVSGV